MKGNQLAERLILTRQRYEHHHQHIGSAYRKHSISFSGAATASPWIYSELLTSRLIRHKKLSEYRQQTILEHAERYDALGVEYNVSIDHLTEVSDGDWLYLWANCKGKGAEITLDTLYKYRGIINAREKN